MQLRKIKKVIYQKIKKLIFWKKIMYYVQRVRLKDNKIIIAEDNETIVPPDIEMWAIFKSGEVDFEAICENKDKAISICETLNAKIKNDKKPGFK